MCCLCVKTRASSIQSGGFHMVGVFSKQWNLFSTTEISGSVPVEKLKEDRRESGTVLVLFCFC